MPLLIVSFVECAVPFAKDSSFITYVYMYFSIPLNTFMVVIVDRSVLAADGSEKPRVNLALTQTETCPVTVSFSLYLGATDTRAHTSKMLFRPKES